MAITPDTVDTIRTIAQSSFVVGMVSLLVKYWLERRKHRIDDDTSNASGAKVANDVLKGTLQEVAKMLSDEQARNAALAALIQKERRDHIAEINTLTTRLAEAVATAQYNLQQFENVAKELNELRIKSGLDPVE